MHMQININSDIEINSLTDLPKFKMLMESLKMKINKSKLARIWESIGGQLISIIIVRCRRVFGIEPEHEDKIVQKGTTKILNTIYENDFLDCSYLSKHP